MKRNQIYSLVVFGIIFFFYFSGALTQISLGAVDGHEVVLFLFVSLTIAGIGATIFFFIFRAVRKKFFGFTADTDFRLSRKFVVIASALMAVSIVVGVTQSYSIVKTKAEIAEKEKAAKAEAEANEKQRLAAISPAEREAEEKRKKEAEMLVAAQNEKNARAKVETEKYQEKYGKPPVQSTWDGSYSAINRYLEKTMDDPDSLKMAGCTDVYKTDMGWLVGCDYRGKNAFGALIKTFNWFRIQNGEVIEILPEDAYSH